jgi:hypothetical protein
MSSTEIVQVLDRIVPTENMAINVSYCVQGCHAHGLGDSCLGAISPKIGGTSRWLLEIWF